MIAQTAGVVVSQGGVVKGTLKTTLSGFVTSVVIETASDVTFLDNVDVTIGTGATATVLEHANIDSVTNNGATTSVVIQAAYGVTFLTTSNVIIGTTSISSANINTATNNGAQCLACSLGKYNVRTDPTAITTISTTIRTETRDGNHRKQHDDEAEDCRFCSAGTYFVSIQEYCKVCPGGFIQTSGSATEAECQECAVGRYNVRIGSDGIDRVEMKYDIASTDHRTGFHRLNHATAADCNYCKAGTFFVGKPTYCKVCPNGWIQDKDNIGKSNK